MIDKIKVTTLGSVSPYPKGTMNCPGFLVNYGKDKILLDCGNGITRNLHFPEDLKNLNVIITHYHNDHFGDIGAIQYASFVYHNLGLLDTKVKIYLPKNDFNFNEKAIMTNKESYVEYVEYDERTTMNFQDLSVSFKDNKSHTIESYMVKIETKTKKIVYTSDVGTKNFENLIEFCQNSDLLICESTFLLEHHSNSKTHLTAFDASNLAKLSDAKMLLLMHFWPEENKSAYLNEAKINFQNSHIAIERDTYEI